MRAALIRDGVVENIILASPTYQPESDTDLIVLEDGLAVGPGWAWDGREFTPPAPEEPEPPAVPQKVTARQARLALLGLGYLDYVEQAIRSMTGPEGAAARIEWEYTSTIERGSPLIGALAPALGLTSEQVDMIFIVADGL